LDDDENAQALVRSTLGLKYRLELFDDLASLRAEVSSEESGPDLLVTELRLRQGSFLDCLREDAFLEKLVAPVVVVSGVEDVDVMRYCFGRGVADYLLKPTRPVELLAKVERALTARLSAIGVRLDPMTLSARRNGVASSALTPKEFQILTMLVSSGSTPVAPERLREALWRSTQVSAKALDVHLSHLRKKLVPLGLRIDRMPQGLVLVGGDSVGVPHRILWTGCWS
jgi:DNA-binding response OmpR family regulator